MLDAARPATGLELKVPQDGYVEDDDWLNVIVTPALPGVRAHQYVEALGRAELELRKKGIEHVLLVPAAAD
jgi:hypothetical protein